MIMLFQDIYLKHRNFWSIASVKLLLGASSLLGLALFIQYLAHRYVGVYSNGTPVGDILLDNLPTINLSSFIIQGTVALTLLTIFLIISHPRYLFFCLKALSLFIIIKSFFTILTHLGVNLDQVTLDTSTVGFTIYDFLYNSKNDFFFSGHVGIPFLFGLIFWKYVFWRNLFLISSLAFGISMILGHLHYSIDVFAAPFITYSIFVITTKIFKSDFALTLN